MYGNCGFAGFFGAGAGAGAFWLPVPEPPVEGLVLPVEGALDDDPAELDPDVVLEVLVAVDGEDNGINGSRVEP